MSAASPRPDPAPGRPLVFLHLGDLHLTDPGERNDLDLQAILQEIRRQKRHEDLGDHGLIDFLYLPGDLAEDGTAAQYDLLRAALSTPHLPAFPICGDHDRHYGHLEDFRDFFGELVSQGQLPDPASFYYARTVAGIRCLFLDLCSAGNGSKQNGLDFRLGGKQYAWLQGEIKQAEQDEMPCAVFMHTYPADLTGRGEAFNVAKLFWDKRVRLVEMGHTHYNELASDGRTLYAAARSIGQNEDGSVGYAVAAIDGEHVSWRFKPLDRTAPFVLVTAPSDRRLATAPGADGEIEVRALVLGDGTIETCQCRADTGSWVPMHRAPGDRLYTARMHWPDGAKRLSVQAIDARWNKDRPNDYIDTDVIEPVSGTWRPPKPPRKPGSDDFRIKAWLEKGVRGDQLGPNRNGRHW